MLGRGALSIASRKVTNEVMKDIVKKHVLAQQGRGPALSRANKEFLMLLMTRLKKPVRVKVNYLGHPQQLL